MSLDDTICNAFTQYMKKYCKHIDLDRVTAWEDKVIYGGYCETCAYTTTGIELTYLTTDGKTKTFEIEESFSQLMNRL